MSSSYKFYSDTKDIMKKYVNATEGAIIYGISKSRIMVLASEAGAVYKVGNSALINTDSFEMYLEVKTSVRLNMSNPQHVKINDVIQNLDPKIFKSKNQFIIDN